MQLRNVCHCRPTSNVRCTNKVRNVSTYLSAHVLFYSFHESFAAALYAFWTASVQQFQQSRAHGPYNKATHKRTFGKSVTCRVPFLMLQRNVYMTPLLSAIKSRLLLTAIAEQLTVPGELAVPATG